MSMKTRLPRGVARRLAPAASILAATLVLASCPNPFEEALATQVTDDGSPVIVIDSPAEGATYQATVTIRGTVTDLDGAVYILSLSVPIADIDEDVEVGEDGAFSTSFSTEGISTSISFTLTATDWNGNTSAVTRTLENDEVGPHIQITEPEDFSAYGTVVRVAGTVTDAPGSITTREVAEASYSVPGTTVQGELSLDPGGTFSFEFPTRNPDSTAVLDGSAVINVTARDYNGNETTASVTILRSQTGDFGSVTVSPESKSVWIEWDSVLHAERYFIHNPRIGEVREYEGSDNRYVWTGLENGRKYSFQIQAVIPDDRGEDAWSTLVDAIPLSDRTLAPRIRELGYRSITIEWNPMTAAGEYLVERRIEDEGWGIRTITPDTVFTDSGLAIDADRASPEYDYRVRPVEQEAVISDYISATPAAFSAEPVSELDVGGITLGMDTDFDVLIAANVLGLVAVDVSDPYNPAELDFQQTDGEALDVAVDADSYAYVADSESGLAVIDVIDPAWLEEPIYADTPGDAWRVDVDEYGYAYIADRAEGLAVMDVNDPMAPAYLTSITSIADAYDVYVDYPYAYVASYEDGLAVVDISDPNNAGVVGWRDTAGTALSVVVVDGHAYVADGSSGIAIIDVSAPTMPGTPIYHATGSNARYVVFDGDHLQVLTENGQVEMLNLRFPDNPYTFAVRAAPNNSRALLAHRGFSYVGGERGVSVFDSATPVSPSDLGFTRSMSPNVTDLSVADSHVYVANGSDGLSIYGVTTPWDPVLADSVVTEDFAAGITVAGRVKYIAQSQRGLAAHGGLSPQDLFLRSYVETPGLGTDVALAGDYALVADSGEGLSVVDISSPDELRVVANRDTSSFAGAVQVYGSYAYVADGIQGLAVIDVSDPLNPGVPIYEPVSWVAWDIAVARGYAFIAEGEAGVMIVDVRDPTNPLFVTRIDLFGDAVGITVSGPYAYVADLIQGFVVLDISDPENPIQVGSSSLTPMRAVAVAGPHAYLLTNDDRMVGRRLW